jgi:hypothetical protein
LILHTENHKIQKESGGQIDLLLEKNVVNKTIDIQKLVAEDKAHVFAMLDAFLQSQKAKKVFAS